jgi:hypothetical protein
MNHEKKNAEVTTQDTSTQPSESKLTLKREVVRWVRVRSSVKTGIWQTISKNDPSP